MIYQPIKVKLFFEVNCDNMICDLCSFGVRDTDGKRSCKKAQARADALLAVLDAGRLEKRVGISIQRLTDAVNAYDKLEGEE